MKISDNLIEESERPINWFENNTPVKKIALLNKEQGYALQIIVDVLHSDYLSNHLPSGEQSLTYRTALEDFLAVFSKAEEDIYQKQIDSSEG